MIEQLGVAFRLSLADFASAAALELYEIADRLDRGGLDLEGGAAEVLRRRAARLDRWAYRRRDGKTDGQQR